MEREENLLTAFSYFDKDGSGYITMDELQQACKDLGLSDTTQLDEMIKEIDQDNVILFSSWFFFWFKFKILYIHFMISWQDGRIDYAEFTAMMRKSDDGMRSSRSMKKGSLNFDLAEALGIDNNTNQSKD